MDDLYVGDFVCVLNIAKGIDYLATILDIKNDGTVKVVAEVSGNTYIEDIEDIELFDETD